MGDDLLIENEYHRAEVATLARANGMMGKEYNSNIGFISDYKKLLKEAQKSLSEQEIPEGLGEWDFKIGDWKIKEYVSTAVQKTAYGLVPENKGLFLFLTFGLGIIGGLIYILPQFLTIPGIKNNQLYQSSLTRGLKLTWRTGFLGSTIVGVLIYGFFYIKNLFWPIFSAIIIGLIIYLVLFREKQKDNNPAKSAAPTTTAWMGVFTGVYFVGFYILLYWSPAYISNWIAIVDPVSKVLSGGNASRWFLYGLMYSVIVIVMGLRMIAKYRHNKYQILRTSSVMFFQTAFAFLIPEIMVRLNQPYFDFKNIWPLDYDFFFNYNLDTLSQNGAIGIFMLVWGILLIVVGVPTFTYFFGKRWYCSWVCGCGGLAETLGDPYRQLSDKSLRAWKFERWIIHGVLVSAIIMTGMVLYTYFTGSYNVL
ncbi:MAG: 4Fe-4S binding protein, partial [Bacteroidota bacterium]